MQDTTTSDRAVSPVIGVVLLVGITVIIAALVGTLVVPMAQSTGTDAPDVSIDFSTQADGDVQLRVVSADDLDASDVTVLVDGSAATMNKSLSESIQAGSTAEAKDVAAGSRVTLRWSGDEETRTLASWEVP